MDEVVGIKYTHTPRANPFTSFGATRDVGHRAGNLLCNNYVVLKSGFQEIRRATIPSQFFHNMRKRTGIIEAIEKQAPKEELRGLFSQVNLIYSERQIINSISEFFSGFPFIRIVSSNYAHIKSGNYACTCMPKNPYTLAKAIMRILSYEFADATIRVGNPNPQIGPALLIEPVLGNFFIGTAINPENHFGIRGEFYAPLLSGYAWTSGGDKHAHAVFSYGFAFHGRTPAYAFSSNGKFTKLIDNYAMRAALPASPSEDQIFEKPEDFPRVLPGLLFHSSNQFKWLFTKLIALENRISEFSDPTGKIRKPQQIAWSAVKNELGALIATLHWIEQI
ncbi:hypothetical protein KJ780_01235 [Candidatus Micrarchaeota archaeon]|nr:hypothetical protein [Candidatus Micrarchaeota archaeon]